MITICLISARPSPCFEWFFQSLAHNNYLDEIGQIIIVDRFAETCDGWSEENVKSAWCKAHESAGKFSSLLDWVAPKPCVWSGKHRLTPRNHWSASSYRNTGLCYAKGDFIAYLDDRCVLMPTWMDAVREARDKQYVVSGTYSKNSGLIVRDGQITACGGSIGLDPRMEGETDLHRRRKCHGEWLFGCTFGLPLEWMLRVNGFDESWDSVSMEDTHFGKMLENNGFPIYHDGRMKMVEDRTPAEQDSSCREHDMKRSSKEKHPHDTNDKTHTLKRKLWGNKASVHPWNLRQIREGILRGDAFPIPQQPTHDWFDGEPLSSMA